MKFYFLSILLFIFLSTGNLFSQSHVFRNYTIKDGLPSSEVYHIMQDSKGYIWFATNKGVCRFDGYHYKIFDLLDGLPDNSVFEIYEDYKGRIWFMPISCRLSYYENGKIYEYQFNDSLAQKIQLNTFPVKRSFFIDTNDNIYFSLKSIGSFKISKDGNIEKIYDYPNITETFLLNCENRFSKLIGVYINKSYQINIFSDSLSYMIKDYSMKENKRGNSIAILNNGNIIYSNGYYLIHIDDSNNYKPYEFDKFIHWLSNDKKNNVWIGTKDHGAFFYPNGDLSNKYPLHFLNGKSISSILQDDEGGLWFSTLDDGVFYIPNQYFSTYTTNDGLYSNNINCFELVKNNEIFIGYNNNYIGLIKNNNIKNLKICEPDLAVIQSLLIDRTNKKLWIGTNRHLNSYNYKNEKSKITKVNNLSINNIKKIIQSNDGGIWIASYKGFYKYKDNEVIYNSVTSKELIIRVNSLFEDKEGALWLGCLNGLWKYYKNKFMYYGDTNHLLKHRIIDIKIAKKHNRLWLATNGAGILFFNNNTIHQITKENGLTSNSITSLFIENDNIWAGTNNGLNKITILNNDNLTYNIETYITYDGLASNEINQVIVNDSNVYVASNSGLTVFNYIKLKPNIISLPIYITNVKIKDKDTTIQDNYKLAYNDNAVTIDFFGISYKNTGKKTYKYKMHDIDNNWIITQNTQAQYPILPPGNYFFQVYVKNYDGFWSENPAAISFEINSPFWLKWWFIGSVIIIISLIIWIIIRWRIKELRKQDKLQHEILSYRQQALSKQMNPHFIFNSLNSIQRFILSNDKLSSSKYLTKFANLMRIILSMSQKESISINDEINALELYLELESLRFEGKFDFHFIIDSNININDFYIPSFFVQPLVENAIWHGLMNKKGKGNLLINFCIEDDVIACIVEDDGIGRKKAQKIKSQETKSHKSLSTSITKTRLELLNYFYDKKIDIIYYDLNDDNGNATGTKVKITFPIIKKH